MNHGSIRGKDRKISNNISTAYNDYNVVLGSESELTSIYYYKCHLYGPINV
jgi:hypothetical protein